MLKEKISPTKITAGEEKRSNRGWECRANTENSPKPGSENWLFGALG